MTSFTTNLLPDISVYIADDSPSICEDKDPTFLNGTMSKIQSKLETCFAQNNNVFQAE